jgi:hypothetical protein
LIEMKRCPKCGLTLTDDNDFCLEDGSRLVVESGNQAFGGMQTSGEMPTQFVPRPQAIAAPSSTGSSPILYLVIGVLSTALAAVGVYVLLIRDDGKKSEIVGANVPQANSTASPTPSTPSPTETSAISAAAEPPKAIPGLSPDGTWLGEWVHGKQTSAFTAVTNLKESNGVVYGQIIWTVRRHTNPQKVNKVGLTAIEYFQGTYDPASRMVRLRGVRKGDPNNLVILDRYNLSLSKDGRSMSGRSKNGSFVLRK